MLAVVESLSMVVVGTESLWQVQADLEVGEDHYYGRAEVEDLAESFLMLVVLTESL